MRRRVEKSESWSCAMFGLHFYMPSQGMVEEIPCDFSEVKRNRFFRTTHTPSWGQQTFHYPSDEVYSLYSLLFTVMNSSRSKEVRIPSRCQRPWNRTNNEIEVTSRLSDIVLSINFFTKYTTERPFLEKLLVLFLLFVVVCSTIMNK